MRNVTSRMVCRFASEALVPEVKPRLSGRVLSDRAWRSDVEASRTGLPDSGVPLSDVWTDLRVFPDAPTQPDHIGIT